MANNYSIINPLDANAEIGIKNSPLYDPTNAHEFNKAPNEKVISGLDNTYIVLGRDRPGGWSSGYGGKGDLKAGAIDIVTGRLSAMDARLSSGPVNPNTVADASRIYLSQKSDIDEAYNICDGVTGQSVALASIAIKSDAVRIIARESLKIITNPDKRLSNGEPTYMKHGVQLIANNDSTDMQPIPKGYNLIKSLNSLVSHINDLNGIVMNFLKSQQEFNKAISDHTHFSPFYGMKTSLDPLVCLDHVGVNLQQLLLVEQGLKSNTNNLTAWKTNYTSTSGPEYINSVFHWLN